jgi:hypothetical protein
MMYLPDLTNTSCSSYLCANAKGGRENLVGHDDILELFNQSYTESDFDASGGQIIRWVEVLESSSMRDVTIVYSYEGQSDTVKATGVWAHFTEVQDDQSASNGWFDMPGPLYNAFHDPNQLAGTFGLLPPSEDEPFRLQHAIGLQITVGPIGIELVPDVLWDISRTIEYQLYAYAESIESGDLISYATFPDNPESANDDDYEDFDESAVPNAFGHMYSLDAPAAPSLLPASYQQLILRFNAMEFVRVGFSSNGGHLGGLGVAGS